MNVREPGKVTKLELTQRGVCFQQLNFVTQTHFYSVYLSWSRFRSQLSTSLATIEQSDEIPVYTTGAMLPAIQFRYSKSFLFCLLVQIANACMYVCICRSLVCLAGRRFLHWFCKLFMMIQGICRSHRKSTKLVK